MTTAAGELAEARRKGIEEGKVLARLDDHDSHFKLINGSISRTGDRLELLTSAVTAATLENKSSKDVAQALLDADERRARALQEMDERRRVKNEEEDDLKRQAVKEVAEDKAQKSEINWIPWARAFVILSIVIQAANMLINYVNKS